MPASITPSLQLKPGQKFKLKFSAVRSTTGGPGQLAAGVVPVWSVDNAAAIRLAPADDGTWCRVLAVGYGSAVITLSMTGIVVGPPNVVANVLVTDNAVPLPIADQVFLTATAPE